MKPRFQKMMQVAAITTLLAGTLTVFKAAAGAPKAAKSGAPKAAKGTPTAAKALSKSEADMLRAAANGIMALAIHLPGTPENDITLRMFTSKPEKEIVIPYFANLAGIGLVGAWERLHEPKYLTLAKDYARWHEAKRNPNGTIYDVELVDGQWQKTNRIHESYTDSTDATAGTHLEFLYRLAKAQEKAKAGSGSIFLKTYTPAIRADLAAIKLTLKQDGLTEALPTYAIKYVMDNTETLRGARCAQMMAKSLRNLALEKEAKDLADNLQTGIDRFLWDTKLGVYKWHKGATEGETDVTTKAFYPYVMSSAMPVAWLPENPRKAQAYAKVKPRLMMLIEEKVENPGDHWDRVVWLGLAAQGMGDTATLENVKSKLAGFNPMMDHWFRLHLDASVCRILAGDPVTPLLKQKH